MSTMLISKKYRQYRRWYRTMLCRYWIVSILYILWCLSKKKYVLDINEHFFTKQIYAVNIRLKPTLNNIMRKWLRSRLSRSLLWCILNVIYWPKQVTMTYTVQNKLRVHTITNIMTHLKESLACIHTTLCLCEYIFIFCKDSIFLV